MQLSVASDGKVVGSIQGCAISGALQADPEGLNLFAAQFKVAAPCAVTASGFALALPLNGGGTQLLLLAEGDIGMGPWDFILAIGRR